MTEHPQKERMPQPRKALLELLSEDGERVFTVTEKQFFGIVSGWTHLELMDEKSIFESIYSTTEHDAAVRKDERGKTDIQLKILRENIKKKEFKPYMNHSKKAVWFEDINEIIESLRDELSCDSQDGG